MGTQGRKRTPVILDTDIGTDIDDTWALAMMLKSPELDVKLIVASVDDAPYRARLTCKLLEAAGRTDIPVAIGKGLRQLPGGQAPWVGSYDADNYPGALHRDGVQALIDAIKGASEPVTLIGIGPLSTVAAALVREPSIVENCRFVGMHGSVDVGYGGKPNADVEYNVGRDIPACARVLSANWKDITITPIDTCGLVRLTGEKYKAVCDCPDPLIRAVIENYRIWLGDKSDEGASSTLFDTVAIHLAYSTDYLVMERAGIHVTDDGFTARDPAGTQMNVAIAWKDMAAFEDDLVARLTG